MADPMGRPPRRAPGARGLRSQRAAADARGCGPGDGRGGARSVEITMGGLARGRGLSRFLYIFAATSLESAKWWVAGIGVQTPDPAED